MGFFDLFRKKEENRGNGRSAKNSEEERLKQYSGMRVEVADNQGQVLFIGKLENLQGNRAQLYQYSEITVPIEEQNTLDVRIRGYSDKEEKAVYLKGSIVLEPERVWRVENLTLLKRENDRAFFRVSTDIDATVRPISGTMSKTEPCKLLNISVGGVCISSAVQYRERVRFLLNVKLMEEREVSLILCEVLRVTQKEDFLFEYGCRFLEMGEADAQKVTQIVFDLQREASLGKSGEEAEEKEEADGN